MNEAASPFTGLGTRAYNRVSDVDQAALVVPKFKGESKTQTLRNIIQARGGVTAATLADEAGLLNTGLVAGLLKHDIAIGRVKYDGKAYQMAEGFDERLHKALGDAAALLRKHGYTVEAPKA